MTDPGAGILAAGLGGGEPPGVQPLSAGSQLMEVRAGAVDCGDWALQSHLVPLPSESPPAPRCAVAQLLSEFASAVETCPSYTDPTHGWFRTWDPRDALSPSKGAGMMAPTSH
jgi:hypothetical protein